MTGPRRVAIVGAGIAGLSCAVALGDAGIAAAVFDKSRRPSGRLAGRAVEAGGHRFDFDYGAQYMTARDPAFVAQVQSWAAAGLVARWPAAGADAWVGTPRMEAPLAAMAGAVPVDWSRQVTAFTRTAAGWSVEIGDAAHGPFDDLVLALPAEQVAALARNPAPALAALAEAHPSQPCWTVMLGFEAPVDAPSIVPDSGAIDRAFRNPAKPGRTGSEAWTVHAAPDWSRRHLEAEREAVATMLKAAFAALVPGLPPPVYERAHRWRYARSAAGGIGCYRDAEAGLWACGDWLSAPRVESAWLSGRQVAAAIIERA